MNSNFTPMWDRGGYRGGRGGPSRHGRGGNRGSWRSCGRNASNFSGQRGGYNSWGDGRGNYGQGGRNNKPQWARPARETPGERLSEEAIGVTEYISDHPGFNGIIKSRYSDFQVSEINEKGEVAKLTNFNPPEPPVDEAVDEDEDLLLTKYNVEILPLETWDSINKVAVSKEENTENVEIDASKMSKEQRTKIHDAVKKAFGDSIVSSTVNIGYKKLLRFAKYRRGVRIDNRVKWIWPGEYVYFVVHKENCDTMDAAVRIAERLRLNIKPSMLGYAGTKDRRAKTSQWFSLRKVDPRKIALACRGMRDVHVGNYSFSDANLRLGMLKGNIFRIALRNVTAEAATVEAACRSLRERGFLNYYGLQRFGTRRDMPTYEIGRRLLQGNFKEAIDGILSERGGPLARALSLYAGAGAAVAARALPPGGAGANHVEARLIRALAKAPNDLLGALDKLARNTRLLYLHAYQSLVWNRAVSQRVRRWGLRPAAGDLVPREREQEVVEDMDVGSFDDDGNHNESEPESDTEKSDSDKNTTSEEPEKPGITGEENNPKVKIPVKVLTEEDVESGQYTIFDVIMPLPGYNIEYPPNMKEYYEEQLTNDGLTLELRHKIKCFSMSGAYRHVAARPLGVSWRSVRYDDPFADLIVSDLAELHHRDVTGIKEDGEYQALVLSMTLPASCYATMALRELLKLDTSGDFHAQQNDYHKKPPRTAVAAPTAPAAVAEAKAEDAEEKAEIGQEVDEESNESSGENGVEKRKLEAEDEVKAKKLKTDDE